MVGLPDLLRSFISFTEDVSAVPSNNFISLQNK